MLRNLIATGAWPTSIKLPHGCQTSSTSTISSAARTDSPDGQNQLDFFRHLLAHQALKAQNLRARKNEIRKPIQLRALVQSHREKYFASVFQKYVIWSRYPVPAKRGASRSSRTLVRDAVDAAASGAIVVAGRASLASGTKRATTNGADADGQGVWS
jgi:hypothetical protein